MLFPGSFRQRANFALYGTLGACVSVSLPQLYMQSTLRHALQKNDREQVSRTLGKRSTYWSHSTLSWPNIRAGRYYTLITSSFNHSSLIHFLGNMLGLWSFGRTVAYQLGARAFLTLYYGGAVTGNLFCLGLDKAQERQQMYLGASGGVCALTAATAVFAPWKQMIIMVAFLPVPINMIMGTLGMATFSVWAQTNGFAGSIAHVGHLGGLAYGVIWAVITKSRGGGLT